MLLSTWVRKSFKEIVLKDSVFWLWVQTGQSSKQPFPLLPKSLNVLPLHSSPSGTALAQHHTRSELLHAAVHAKRSHNPYDTGLFNTTRGYIPSSSVLTRAGWLSSLFTARHCLCWLKELSLTQSPTKENYSLNCFVLQ